MANPTVQLYDDDVPPRSIVGPMALIVVVVIGCSLWSNLATLVTNQNNYRFFPPFERFNNANQNDHLGAEYNNIAGAIVAGQGFADPFHRDRDRPDGRTGPTAWMAPMLAWILAGLRFVTGNDKEAIIALFVLLEDITLIGTGLLVVLLGRRSVNMTWTPAFLYVLALAFNFRLSFQFTHDCWLILAFLDMIVAGLVWLRPFDSGWLRAFGWGMFGGLCALTSPVVGFTWGVTALPHALRLIPVAPRRRASSAAKPLVWLGNVVRGCRRSPFFAATLAAMLTISPWVIRNYIAFGKFIPVKSNLYYELWQSQCQTNDGVLHGFGGHPFVGNNPERQRYRELKEIKFIDEKRKLFWESVNKKPLDFAERVASRFFAATLVYTPAGGNEERSRPVLFWINRLAYPLPFVALLFLVVTMPLRPLSAAQGIGVGVYLAYLMPYVLVSFYDRYKYPLLGVEVMLVTWAIARVFSFIFGDRLDDDLEEAELADPEFLDEPFTAAPAAADADYVVAELANPEFLDEPAAASSAPAETDADYVMAELAEPAAERGEKS